MNTMRTVDAARLTSLLTGRAWPAEPRVVVSGNLAVPWTLLTALDGALPRYRLHALNAPAGLPRREGVSYETTFVGPGMRHSARLSYVPARLSLVPLLLGGALAPDIVLVQTSALRQGRLSLGSEVNILPAAIEACRQRGGLVFAQANAQMPYTFGDGEYDAHVFDGVLEVDEPLPALPSHVPGPAAAGDVVAQHAAAQIGALVAARVPDGATLQLGIGEVPDATLPGLARRRRLALWSEMFSDGVLRLEEAGALDRERPIISSFAFGSQELYGWMNANPRIVMRRTELTNSPSEISRQPLMTSINTALQVDLFAQANASRIGARIHSGFGGQTDFIVGALHAPGGQALMALRSWHPRAQVSTIVPILLEPTTSFQPTAVITEQGVAELLGADERRQAAALIDQAAHPDAREHLWLEARRLGLT